MAKKRFYDGDYSGPLNVARREEKKDFSMLSEDHSAPANLPQDVKYHAWPKAGRYATYDYEDTIKGIDDPMSDDDRGLARQKHGYKY